MDDDNRAPQPNDPILTKALERRERAIAEIREINGFLTTYASLAGISLEALGLEPADVPSTPGAPTKIVPGSSYSRPMLHSIEADDPASGMPQREFADLAKELLLARGRPMSSQALLAAFHDMGRRVGGKNELRALTTKLWRASDEITKVPGAGYWPLDVPCPAVRYVPPNAITKSVRPDLIAHPSVPFPPDQPPAFTTGNVEPGWKSPSTDELDDEIPF